MNYSSPAWLLAFYLILILSLCFMGTAGFTPKQLHMYLIVRCTVVTLEDLVKIIIKYLLLNIINVGIKLFC